MKGTKFTNDDLDLAIAQLGTMKFFPHDPGTRGVIKAKLVQMVPHKEALLWLIDTLVDRVGHWHNLVEVRGVLCARYRPADGIEANCVETIGFRAVDAEARAVQRRHEGLNDAGLLKQLMGR